MNYGKYYWLRYLRDLRDWHILSAKGQLISMLAFVGHTVCHIYSTVLLWQERSHGQGTNKWVWLQCDNMWPSQSLLHPFLLKPSFLQYKLTITCSQKEAPLSASVMNHYWFKPAGSPFTSDWLRARFATHFCTLQHKGKSVRASGNYLQEKRKAGSLGNCNMKMWLFRICYHIMMTTVMIWANFKQLVTSSNLPHPLVPPFFFLFFFW